MEVYISEDYLKVFENIVNEKCNDLINIDRIYNLKLITNLLNALPVSTDISREFARSIIDLSNDQTKVNTIYTSLIASLINTTKVYPIDFSKVADIPNYSGYYFMTDKKLLFDSDQSGLVIKNEKYQGEDYYNKLTCAHVNIEDNNFSSLNDRIPPCNAMLIYDRYLFDPFYKKFDNLKKFIEIFSKGLRIKFHLTLIFSTKIGTKDLISLDNLHKCFGLLNKNNIQAQFIINNESNDKRLSSDRLIFTNYTTINIGHPFHKYRTVFNQNFLGSGFDCDEIIKNYDLYKSELKDFLSTIDQANLNYCSSFEIVKLRLENDCRLFSINPEFQENFINSLFHPKIARKNKIQIIKKQNN